MYETRDAFREWLKDPIDPAMAFTDGPLRDAAYAVQEFRALDWLKTYLSARIEFLELLEPEDELLEKLIESALTEVVAILDVVNGDEDGALTTRKELFGSRG